MRPGRGLIEIHRGADAPSRREMWVVQIGPESRSSVKDSMKDCTTVLAFDGRRPLHRIVSRKIMAANAMEAETQSMS